MTPFYGGPITPTLHLPKIQQPAKPSWMRMYARSLLFAVTALLLLALLLEIIEGKGRIAKSLSRPSPVSDQSVLMSSRGVGLIVILVAAGTLYFEAGVQFRHRIEVDMMISRGNGVDLFLNDWQHPAERVEAVPGQRHIYRFGKVPREITLLRLDPTDLPDARIVIYGVAIRNRSQIFQQFGPAEVKGWNRNNLSAPKDEDGGVALTDLNDDPILTTTMSLRLPGGIMQSLASLIDTIDGPFLLAMAVFPLVLLVRIPPARAGCRRC